MGADIDELKTGLTPATQKILIEIIQGLTQIQRTGYGALHVEIKEHKRWHVRTTVSAASGPNNQ